MVLLFRLLSSLLSLLRPSPRLRLMPTTEPTDTDLTVWPTEELTVLDSGLTPPPPTPDTPDTPDTETCTAPDTEPGTSARGPLMPSPRPRLRPMPTTDLTDTD